MTYRVVEKRLDWTGALHVCESLNGTLASVKDPFQQAYLTLLINSLHRPAWISLYNYGVGRETLIVFSQTESDRSEPHQAVFNSLCALRGGASPGWARKMFRTQTGRMESPISWLDAVT